VECPAVGKNQTIDLILGMTAAVATALLMGLIARDNIGMPPDMVREDALIAAGIVGRGRRSETVARIGREQRLILRGSLGV
jgi:hypothetical protein